jgi:hypothetical protein
MGDEIEVVTPDAVISVDGEIVHVDEVLAPMSLQDRIADLFSGQPPKDPRNRATQAKMAGAFKEGFDEQMGSMYGR